MGRGTPSSCAKLATQARITFVRPPCERAYIYVFEPPAGVPPENCEPDERLVSIANARFYERAASLDREGFELISQATRMREFEDTEEVKRVYYPECENMVRLALGARQAIVFDHLVRKRGAANVLSALGRGDARSDHAGPAGRAHNDYSASSGAHRLNLVLGRPEGTPAVGRFAIINIWRSARGPIIDAPLALCDSTSVRSEDLVDTEIRYPRRSGAIYQLAHGPEQRWAYFHELQPEEAIIFKQFDSDVQRPRFTPHAAFEHPDTPAGAPPRESIEVRCLALF